MAHCLSCFRKKSDTGFDADAPPQPHRPNDNRDKVNERKIAPPANIGPLKTNGASRAKNDMQSDHIDDRAGQGDETSEEPSSDLQPKAETRTGSRNLWEVAAQRLDESSIKWLKIEDPPSIDDVIKKIQNETKESYKRIEKQELGAREKKEGTFNARAKFKNLLGFTLQAQDLITAGLSFDVTGYASTAWSVVSFGLTLLQKDIERHDLVMSASEYLAGVLSYHTTIDNNYRLEYAQANEGLEDALVEVYVAILKYAAEVEKAKREGPGQRLWGSITALVDNPLEDLKACVDSMSDVVDRWKSLVRDEDQSSKIEGILSILRNEVIRNLKKISLRTHNDEELSILDWISTFHYSKPQNDEQRNRSSNTGNWIVESQVYTDWKANPGELLWLRGTVGCGKSYLCSTIIHDIEQYCEGAVTDVLAYWYFDFSDENTQYVENMVRCLLHQLAPSPLPSFMREWWNDHRKNKEPEYVQLLDALHSIIQNLPGSLFLVFDALDECPQEPRGERESLLQLMEDLIEKHQKRLHLLATSRPEPDILDRLQKYTGFDLEASLGGDVEKFVKTQLKHGKLKRWQSVAPTILDKIEDRLIHIPEKRFRWADLQIKRLEGCHKQEDIEMALESVPVSLEESYKHILLEIDPRDRPRAMKILTWLSFSLAPLALQAVQTIAELEISDSVIEICTTSLVTIDAENIIRLAHFSVKEFLISEYVRKEVGFFHLSAQPAHGVILERLLRELHEYSTICLNESNSQNKPLLDYAARFWDGHMKELCGSTPPEDFAERIDHIFLHKQCYFNWIRLRDDRYGHSKFYLGSYRFPSPIEMVSRVGLIRTAQRLLVDREALAPGEIEDKVYFHAAKEGHLSLLILLLKDQWKPSYHGILRILCFIDDSKERDVLEIVFSMLWELDELVKLQPDGTGVFNTRVGINAMGNEKCGLRVGRLLFDRTGPRLKFDLDSFLHGAALSPHPEQVLGLVLEHLDRAVGPLGYGVYKLAKATTSPKMARLLFSIITRPEYWNDNLLEALVRYLNFELLEVFFQDFHHEFEINDEILFPAAQNERDFRTLSFLFKEKPPNSPIEDEIFYAATGNQSQGLSVFKTLLDYCGHDRLIDETTISIIIRREDKKSMMEELLRRKQSVSVSKEILLEAAEFLDSEQFQYLLAIVGPHISVTEEVLFQALESNSGSLFEYILDCLGPKYVVSEKALCLAATNRDMSQARMSILLDRTSSPSVPNSVFIRLIDNPLLLETILDRNQSKAPVQDIVQLIAEQSYKGTAVIELLIDRGLISVDEELIELFARHENVLHVIFAHSPMLKATKKAFELTKTFDQMHALLNFEISDLSISEDIIKNLVSFRDREKSFHAEIVLRLLLARFGSKVPITQDTLLLAANSPSYLGDLIRIFLDEKRPLDLQLFWERLWQNHCRFVEEVSDVLLEYTALEIPKSMLESVSNSKKSLGGRDSIHAHRSNFENTSSTEASDEGLDDEHDFLARFVWFSVERNLLIPQDVMGVIMEKGHFRMIVVVLEHNPHLKITDEILSAARKNPDCYDVMWFLEMFPDSWEAVQDSWQAVQDPDDAGHILHWPPDSRRCHLSNCKMVHSTRKRKRRQAAPWNVVIRSNSLRPALKTLFTW